MPAWASTMAAASPFGPAPITQALPFIGERSASLCTHHCRGETVGHSVTLILPVLRALKLDLVAATRHHGEQSVLICNSKWFQRRHRRSWQRQTWRKHPDQLHGRRIKDPAKHHAHQGKLHCSKLQTRRFLPCARLFGWARVTLAQPRFPPSQNERHQKPIIEQQKP